jgi:hypothetical protein
MVFTTEDRILIKCVYLLKGYNVMRLFAEFPHKNWKKLELKKLLRCIVRCKNCRLSSMKNNVICAIYNFTRYCSYMFRVCYEIALL